MVITNRSMAVILLWFSLLLVINIRFGADLTIYHRVQRRMISVVNFFSRIFEIISFCFVVAICNLVHDVETIFHLSYVLTASGNLF